MPTIKPVSDLRNYNEVLRECRDGEPVFLTKNGRGKYVLMDIQDYEKQQTIIELLSKLSEAETTIKNGEEWLTLNDLKNRLGV
ncbi:MAG TPA: prevent-host-death protein [Syntrophomonas sp.]|jgi:prevent-host-death family protein|nr:prevent-host-death protein [Syntrophomonas sp.]